MSLILPFVLAAWGLFVFCVIKGRQRFRNSFVLLNALIITAFSVTALFGERMREAIIAETLLLILALMLVPFLLIWNGLIMYKREGHSISNMLSLLMGVAVGIGEACFLISMGMIKPGGNTLGVELMALVGWSAFYFCVVFLSFVLYVIAVTILPHNYNYDYIIIHGCGLIDGDKVSKLLSERLDKSIVTYKKCVERASRSRLNGPIMIPSGGKGGDEKMAEADAMLAYLIKHGIPEERIIKENQSPSTETNLVYSKSIIDERGGGRVALVTSNYHVYRCLTLAKEIGLNCTGIGSHVAGYFWPSAVIREFAAIFSEKKKLFWLLLFWVVNISMLSFIIK